MYFNLLSFNLRLLFLLTLPIECLLNLDDLDSSAQAINELTQSLYEAKKSFSESETIKAILNPINLLFKKVCSSYLSTTLSFSLICCFDVKGKLISNEDKELINYSILLIKNILHPVPIRLQTDTDLFPHKKFSQSILSNLFTYGFDRLIIRILAASQHHVSLTYFNYKKIIDHEKFVVNEFKKSGAFLSFLL